MTTPQYDPKTIFRKVPTITEQECYFCPDPITIEVPEYIETQLPDKIVLKFHPYCFDQFAWSMFHYYALYRPTTPPKDLLN